MVSALQFVFGFVSLAAASAVFWQVGQESGAQARWRRLPGIDLIVVTIVLGGWTAGTCFVIYAIINWFS